MEEGFVPSGGGLNWLRRHDARNEFAQGLPGTASVEGRLRLPAWRCRACELVMLRYGRGVRGMINRLDQMNAPATSGEGEEGEGGGGNEGGGGGGGEMLRLAGGES